jgi:hypothetical protein
MGLKTMSLLSGSTVSATGGSAVVFADDGVTIPNGVHLVVPGDTDYATRRSATAKYRPPVLNTAGEYTKDKKYISITRPLTLASGKVVNNVLRVEREVHPELSAADAADLNKIAAQLLFDADLDAFWAAGSLS